MPKASIFEGKDPKSRFQGLMTKVGAKALVDAKKKLAGVYREEVGVAYGTISDGDAVEALARGWDDVRAYLRKTKLP